MNRQLAEAWGEFLSRYKWDWFMTLTFRDEVRSFRAHRLFQSFMRDLEKAAGVPIFWFRADEIGPHGGRFHIHALVGNVAHVRRMSWVDKWDERAGYARILPFDARRGAAYYCAKYVTKQVNDWDLSDDLKVFTCNQPVLPLQGGVKPKSNKVEAPPEKHPSPQTRSGRRQLPLPCVLQGPPVPGESQLMQVYKSEVTRGRRRYRDFGFKI